ncbi:MAG: hypothetical protein CR986_05675 [Ignavibacteriae bacterium]|nr:MAG: hypothetical protein CR986_05675 [Ignavibacteriota bacterium]
MKNFLFCFLFVTSLGIAQFANPQIATLEESFDFGDIKRGEIVTHNFVLFNSGSDTLKILNVKASCGCTAAKPIKNKLLPGDSTSVKVTFNSKGRFGKQKKFIYIFSNDPKNKQKRLQFTANILTGATDKLNMPEIKLSKYTHNFGNIEEGQVLDLTIQVKNIGNKNLVIKRIKSSCGCTAVLMADKNLAPNQSSDLKIEFNSKGLSGQIARTITIYSNDSKHPSRVITLIANIKKD